ncbi:MAG: hypothetical protein JO057_09935 [Chloroflexi bacterium]|nr:hypothetical protein [Chloroflexota bacterium]
MQIDLSADETAVVSQILESALGELREEIYKSELAEYKARLKQRETVITGVISRLGTSASSA